MVDDGVSAVARIQTLQTLILSVKDDSTGPSSYLEGDCVSTIARLPALTRLDLSEHYKVDSTTMQALAQISTLVELKLQGCSGVNDDVLKALAAGLPAISHLDISGFRQHGRLSDEGVQVRFPSDARPGPHSPGMLL